MLLDLAADSRQTVPADLPDYIRQHDIVRAALRVAKEVDATDEEWKAFTHVCLNRQANGLSCGSVILLEQLRTIDKSRLRERVGALDTSEMKQIDWALGVSVGLVEGYR
nr:type II toxin-antitoxin system PemK/MazF family toxin [Intestinimonas massiliensis (ex Afouda et al. 2020)]